MTHPTPFASGTYTVTCLYGSSIASTNTTPETGMTAGTCTRTMTVSDSANGCSRIIPYRGSTLSSDLQSSTNFDASFRCGSREPFSAGNTDTNAYRLQIGTSNPAFLGYDRDMADFFS